MNIQFYPEDLNYVNAKLHPEAPKVGSFLNHFLNACLHADGHNYDLLRPVLQGIMKQYPADPARLWMEYHDSGQEPPFPKPESLP